MSNVKKTLRTISSIAKDKNKRIVFGSLVFCIFACMAYLASFHPSEFINKLTIAFATSSCMSIFVTFYEIVTGFDKKSSTFSDMICLKCKSGIKDIKPNRDAIDLAKLLSECKKGDTIRILLVSLDTLNEHRIAFIKCAKNGVNIQMCVYTPAKVEKYVKSRKLENTKSPAETENKFSAMKTSLFNFIEANDDLAREKSKNNSNSDIQLMDIRISDKLPTTVMIMVNNDCFVPLMLYHVRSSKFIHLHFCLKDGEESSKEFTEHFTQFFEDAKNITNQQLDSIERAFELIQTSSDKMEKYDKILPSGEVTKIKTAIMTLKDTLTNNELTKIESNLADLKTLLDEADLQVSQQKKKSAKTGQKKSSVQP